MLSVDVLMAFLRDQTSVRKPACRVRPRSRCLCSLGCVSRRSRASFIANNLGYLGNLGARSRKAGVNKLCPGERFREMPSGKLTADQRLGKLGRVTAAHSYMQPAAELSAPMTPGLRRLASIDARAIRAEIGRTTRAQQNSLPCKIGSLARSPIQALNVRVASGSSDSQWDDGRRSRRRCSAA